MKFIREEMERTWGSSHLAILSEEEAQNWLLGVSLFRFLGAKGILGPFQNWKYFKFASLTLQVITILDTFM